MNDYLDQIIDAAKDAQDEVKLIAKDIREYIESTSVILEQLEFEGKDQVVSELANSLDRLADLE